MDNSCIKRDIFCNKTQEDNNVIIVEINESIMHQNKRGINNNRNKDKRILNLKKESSNQNINKREIKIFNIQSKFKCKLFKSNLNSNTLKNSSKSKNDQLLNEANKYKKNSEIFDKLIHFTNINERKIMNTSVSTSNIK